MKLYYVYILASDRRVLYVGVTSSLELRITEHRARVHENSFTARYNVDRLVYFEDFTRAEDAIAREKEIKGWRRSKKVALIERANPEWRDLAPASGELPPMTRPR